VSSRLDDLLNPSEEDKSMTEAGTVGFVKRKEAAEDAKAQYQRGKDSREVRDKTLYYAEIDARCAA
jgi:hypothetical protein